MRTSISRRTLARLRAGAGLIAAQRRKGRLVSRHRSPAGDMRGRLVGSAVPVFPVPVLALGDLLDNRFDPARACLLTLGLEYPFDIVAPLARRKSVPMRRSR